MWRSLLGIEFNDKPADGTNHPNRNIMIRHRTKKEARNPSPQAEVRKIGGEVKTQGAPEYVAIWNTALYEEPVLLLRKMRN